MFELITAKFDCHCAISGRLIKQGQDMYYNYITKTCIHPVEYEQSINAIQKSGTQSYFQRHQKLNK
ncbi:MAG: hypothetical protein RLZ39_1652 [Bacteroidota bacterium]|jgi:hypothetical protein